MNSIKVTSILLIFTYLTACAAGLSKRCVNGVCTYQKDGKTLSKQEAANYSPKIREELKREQDEKAFQEKLALAPKRKPGEKINLSLLKFEALNRKEARFAFNEKMDREWRKHFRYNSHFINTPNSQMVKYQLKRSKQLAARSNNPTWYEQAKNTKTPGEVYVHIKMAPKNFIGLNLRGKGKLIGEGTKFELVARVSSSFTKKEYTLTEDIYNVFKYDKHLKNLSQKVANLINKKIAPYLPSRTWLQQNQQNDLNKKAEALKKFLKL